ncbi:hypothetical protein RB195_007986 [Necator americanus]|uniref:Uncharacterized protein n=1 Tax=Necator americanus TaxID=51031 RepID=A0ABR1BZV2_NECAM
MSPRIWGGTDFRYDTQQISNLQKDLLPDAVRQWCQPVQYYGYPSLACCSATWINVLLLNNTSLGEQDTQVKA